MAFNTEFYFRTANTDGAGTDAKIQLDFYNGNGVWLAGYFFLELSGGAFERNTTTHSLIENDRDFLETETQVRVSINAPLGNRPDWLCSYFTLGQHGLEGDAGLILQRTYRVGWVKPNQPVWTRHDEDLSFAKILTRVSATKANAPIDPTACPPKR